MIKISSLSKSFGQDLILNNVDCHIKENIPTVLLGPSGAGKSTLLRCINGLVTPDAGEISVNGVILRPSPEALRSFRTQIGFIFQQFNLIRRLTVMENVLCGRLAYLPLWKALLRKFTPEDYELAGHYLDKVGLYAKRWQKASELSGGQQQRVGIARALVQRPKVLLADEPVASLDPKSSARIMELLIAISAEEGITPVITLHSVELALKYSQEIIGLRQGRIIALCKTADTRAEELYGFYDNNNIA